MSKANSIIDDLRQLHEGYKTIAGVHAETDENGKVKDPKAKKLIEDKLGEKLDEEVDYKKIEQEIKANPAHKRLKSLCNKYGYDFDMAYIRSSGKFYVLKFSPYVIGNNKYLRDIYVENTAVGKDVKSATKVEFKAQTTSFGALDKDEFTKFSHCVGDTMNLLHALSSFDFSKLTVAEVEDL